MWDDNEKKLDDIKQIICTDDNGKIDFSSYTIPDFERWSKRRRFNNLISPRADKLRRYWELVKEPFQCFENVDRETANAMLADYYAHIPTNELRLSNDLTDEEFRKEFEEIANKYQVFPIPADYDIEEQVNVHVKDLSALVSMHVGLVSRVMGTDAANMTDEIQIFTHLFLSKYNQLDEKICCDSPLESDSSKSDRAIIRRKNMLTLLNLADDINRFGTLRNLNEMGGMGENSIKDVKEKVNKYKHHSNDEITKHTLLQIIQERILQQYSHDLKQMHPNCLTLLKII